MKLERIAEYLREMFRTQNTMTSFGTGEEADLQVPSCDRLVFSQSVSFDFRLGMEFSHQIEIIFIPV